MKHHNSAYLTKLFASKHISIEMNCLLLTLKNVIFRSLELSPNDPKALFRRCQAYEALDQVDKAYQDGREVRLALNV